MNKRKISLKTLIPIVKRFFSMYKGATVVVLICILINSFSSISASLFVQSLVSTIEKALEDNVGTIELFNAIKPDILNIIIIMIIVYVLGIISSIVYNQTMAYVGQGFLNKMRKEMFNKMESLPIKYFDRNPHGSIMSHYTNDVDTLRHNV